MGAASPYEFLNVVVQSDLFPAFLEFLNAQLPVPASWFEGQATFMTKTSKPRQPKDLRPIMIPPTVCKLFTKLLLRGTRNSFPSIRCGQLCAQSNCQSLDGRTCLLRLVHLSSRWKLPPLACKLDIAAAFDCLHHSAISRLFACCIPTAEGLFPQELISNSMIHIGMAGESWTQPTGQGMTQGSAYNAEVFACVLDWHLDRLRQ